MKEECLICEGIEEPAICKQCFKEYCDNCFKFNKCIICMEKNNDT